MHTFSITVEIDPLWIDLVTSGELFRSDISGYWLRGIELNPEKGWLCWEDDDVHVPGREPDREDAINAWHAGVHLPPGWYRLDRAAALRAWEEGVKRWGADWYKAAAEPDQEQDEVIQLALLGEIRYG